jgi:hypothetical protein
MQAFKCDGCRCHFDGEVTHAVHFFADQAPHVPSDGGSLPWTGENGEGLCATTETGFHRELTTDLCRSCFLRLVGTFVDLKAVRA